MVFDHNDFRIAEKAYYFWTDFLQELGRLDPPKLRNDKINRFLSIFENLIRVCYKRMIRTEENMESDDENDVVESDDEDHAGGPRLSEFETHRLEVGEILVYLIWACTENALALTMATKITDLAMRATKNPDIEAGIISFKSIAKEIAFSSQNSPNGRAIENMLKLGLSKASYDISIRRATCDLICDLAEHISSHPEVYIDSATKFLVESIRIESGRSCRHACYAFKHLGIKRGSSYLVRAIESLFTQINPYDTSLQEDCRLDLLEGIVSIWLNELIQVIQNDSEEDHQRLKSIFQSFCAPPLQNLSMLISSANTSSDRNFPSSKPFIESVDAALQSLTVFIKYSNLPSYMSPEMESTPEAIEFILSKIWPSLPQFHVLHEKNFEQFCKFLKYAIRTFPAFVRENIRSLFEFIVQHFRDNDVSYLLYLTGVIFKEFFDCPELIELFPPVLSELSRLTLEKVLNTRESFITHPDFVEDLFYLGNRTVEYLPDAIVQTDAFDRLFGMASEVGVTLEHPEAFRSVTIFLESAISLGIVSQQREDISHTDERYRPYVNQVYLINVRTIPLIRM